MLEPHSYDDMLCTVCGFYGDETQDSLVLSEYVQTDHPATFSVTVPGVGISECGPSVVNELLICADLTSSRSGAECEHDPLNYSQAKALSESGTIGALKLFQCTGGYGSVNLGGNLYGFAPVCLVDADGNIYEDKPYLACMENRQTADETTLQNDDIQQQGDMETELLMIDDPDAVKEYLSFIREDIERYTKVDTLPPEDFEELRQGSSGEDVRELQEALLASGWLMMWRMAPAARKRQQQFQPCRKSWDWTPQEWQAR